MKFNLEPEDIEQASAMRDSAMHPSEFEFGMSDAMDDDALGVGLPDDIMLGGGSEPSGGFGMSDMGMMGPTSGFGMSDMGGMGPIGGGMGPMGPMDSFGTGSATQKEEKDFDEKAFEAVGMLFKGGWQLLQTCVKAFPNMTANDFMGIFKSNTITGIACCVIGVILLLFKQHIGWSFVAGGAVTSVLSFGLFAINLKKSGKTIDGTKIAPMDLDMYDETERAAIFADNADNSEDVDEDMFEFEDDENNSVSDSVAGGGDDFEFPFGDDADMGEIDGTGFIGADGEVGSMTASGFDMMEDDDVVPLAFEDDEDMDDMPMSSGGGNTTGRLNDVEIKNGMVTRQYLYEKFSNAIQTCTPKFADFEELSDKSEEFKNWNAVVANALSVLAPAKAPEVYLLSVKKKIFCYVLEIQRANWMKNSTAIVNEIVNALAYDKQTNRRNPDIYGSGDFSGKSLFVKIVTGDTAQVTIKDIMLAEKEFFLNTKNRMPVALGISMDGTPILDDMRNIDYMLVSGLPRRGKSWFVKAMIGQLMFFNSPDEVNFYFLDPKDHASDFASVQTPHVKKFVADDAAIIETLRDLVVTEGARRSAILQEYEVQNIWELRDKRPDIDMPVIYILIDEVVTLASRMEKETAKEFQNLLLQCISRLAFVGIRMMLIPHLVKHDILNKSITDLIVWRACVGGTVEQVSSVTGDKKFKARLKSIGDLALLHDSTVEFVHSCSIATTNSGYKDTFEYIAAFWTKVNPQYVTDVEVIHSSVEFVQVTDEMLDDMAARDTEKVTPKTVKPHSVAKHKAVKANKSVSEKQTTGDTVYVIDTDDDDIDIW